MWHLVLTLLPGMLSPCIPGLRKEITQETPLPILPVHFYSFTQAHAAAMAAMVLALTTHDDSCLYDRRGGYAQQCVVAALLS